MRPYLVISSPGAALSAWLDKYFKEEGIDETSRVELHPALKQYSIDQIRELKKDVAYTRNKPFAYVLFDFDKASFEAQNAFLKTLEEHSPNITFILTASSAHALPPTVVSRCSIVILEASDNTPKAYPKIQKELESYLQSSGLASLGSAVFDVKSYEDPQELFLSFLLFYRSRLATDSAAPRVLREVLTLATLVRVNNVSAQHATDAILLFIKDGRSSVFS